MFGKTTALRVARTLFSMTLPPLARSRRARRMFGGVQLQLGLSRRVSSSNLPMRSLTWCKSSWQSCRSTPKVNVG